MTRLLLGVTLERICKAVLLLCLLHFVIIMILYFDVYAQHLDFFSRFNARNTSRVHPFSNSSRPNSTAPSYGPAGAEPPSPSAKPNTNRSVTEKPLQPCQEMPSGLGEMCRVREGGGVGCWWGMSPEQGFPVIPGWRNPRLALVPAQLIATVVWERFWESFVLGSAGPPYCSLHWPSWEQQVTMPCPVSCTAAITLPLLLQSGACSLSSAPL